MKRLLIILALLFLFCGQAMATAVGTITLSKSTFLGGNMAMIQYHCVASADDGSFPTTPTSASVDVTGGIVSRVVVISGSTNPTALFDMSLTGSIGLDLMGGVMNDLAAAANTSSPPYYVDKGIYGDKPFVGPLTLTITGNSVHSAIVDVYVFVRLK
jgi:hypothetical protein